MNDSINFRAIDDPALIEVLASPIRQEIVDMLAALGGEASAGDVAEHLGRHVDGLYYHLKILCKAGLVAAVDAGADGGRRFRLSGDARPLRLAYKTADEAQAQTLRMFIHGLLQVAEQDFNAALTKGDVITQGSERELWAARNKAWLSADELVEVNELLERLCVLMSRPRTPERDRLLSCTFVLVPNRAVSKRRSMSDKESE
ncbi:helix-turn-helix domain-containing protein [Massilia antarctica]|uniref:helix-turn-helix domain-containing protein n=1 Tax=Massilia antarctica TaxID=2765360 RepID=UPI0006BB6182|nr:helix-turn-helix domain-containing protein [Massilia sp. H27-R4]MCY0911724.1 helix-turn-helix domain-containing protein [Massilia sp. H27-R4]